MTQTPADEPLTRLLMVEDDERLAQLTAPKLGFPQSMQPIFPSIHNGGTTVNGVHSPISPFTLQAGDTPY